MRLLCLSDLHFNWHRDAGVSFVKDLPSSDKVDAVVIAGDLTEGPGLTEALGMFCDRYEKVVYCAGNHEYYEQGRAITQNLIWDAVAAHPNLTWLNNEAVVINGQRFIGGTLWFSDDPRIPEDFKLDWSDFARIPCLDEWVYADNLKAVKCLAGMRAGDIVVTHHLPTRASVAPQYRGMLSDAFYVCDVEDHIRIASPKLVVHGHTHVSLDYLIDETRVVCNPFGYARKAENPKFDFGKIVVV